MDNERVDMIARLAMQGKGTALREQIEGLGLEDRISLLRKIASRAGAIRQQEKSLPALRVIVEWIQEDDVVADSKLRHHLQVRLCQEVIKVFAGDCIYQECLYLFDPDLRREVNYFDVAANPDKKRSDETHEQLEEHSVNMSMRVIESLIRRHDLSDKDAVLSRLRDVEWIEKEGYGHIAHVLGGDTGREACRRVFEVHESTQSAPGKART